MRLIYLRSPFFQILVSFAWSRSIILLDVGKCNRICLREHPDMMSASEGGGGHGKTDVVREVA